MLEGSEEKARSLQGLSALADGELGAEDTLRACTHWRGDGEARVSWYAYHLIGDVMRSDEMASDAARDAGFLQTLKLRLASEPVVLAPQALAMADRVAPAVTSSQSAARGSRWSWMAPAAVAAGFMAVASVLVVTRGIAPPGGPAVGLAQSLAGGGQVAPAPVPAANGGISGEPQTFVADGKLIRDSRLERYYAAHKEFGGSSALGVPSGFLRAATVQMPDR